MGVAQPVERWIVVPVVEGSNPSTHPKPKKFMEGWRPGLLVNLANHVDAITVRRSAAPFRRLSSGRS